MTADEGLFDVVAGSSHYKPRPTFLLPHEGDFARGPGRAVTTGPGDAAAPNYWKRDAERVLFTLLRTRGQVTSDDLRAHYADEPSATAAAIGALFRSLSKQGRIILDHHRPSSRREARGRVVGVWRLP